jgi:hypothetical protein
VIIKHTVGEAVFFVIYEKSQLKSGKMDLDIGIFSGGKMLDETNATFFGPEK